jgi:CheY-like chemotaxis protein
MPDMSGTELVAELKRLRPDLPAILMSGYGGPDLQAQAHAAGAYSVLMKPLTAVELAHCLAGLFDPAGATPTAVQPLESA